MEQFIAAKNIQEILDGTAPMWGDNRLGFFFVNGIAVRWTGWKFYDDPTYGCGRMAGQWYGMRLIGDVPGNRKAIFISCMAHRDDSKEALEEKRKSALCEFLAWCAVMTDEEWPLVPECSCGAEDAAGSAESAYWKHSEKCPKYHPIHVFSSETKKDTSANL